MSRRAKHAVGSSLEREQDRGEVAARSARLGYERALGVEERDVARGAVRGELLERHHAKGDRALLARAKGLLVHVRAVARLGRRGDAHQRVGTARELEVDHRGGRRRGRSGAGEPGSLKRGARAKSRI